jgi:alpha-D-ribose 1-methylphosphonate 5-phosphate C-P lyase
MGWRRFLVRPVVRWCAFECEVFAPVRIESSSVVYGGGDECLRMGRGKGGVGVAASVVGVGGRVVG